MSKGRVLIGFVLSAVLLYLFLRNIDLGQVWSVIRSGNPQWLVIAVVFNVLNYFIRAVRWRYFLLPIKKTRLWNLYNTTVIGFALSALFPARIGEVVRPYLLGMKENISRTSALATVVVERLFDTLTILFMLVFYLLVLIQPETLSEQARASMGDLKKTGLVVFGIVILGLVFLYYMKRNPERLRRIINWIARFLPKKVEKKIDELLDSFIEGLSILHDPLLILKISAWSLFFWIVIAISFWAGVHAFEPRFPFTGTFLIMIILAIGIAVPTPGGIGSYHLAIKIGLTRFFDVPDTQASAIALVSHFLSFAPVILQGIIFIWHEGLTAKKLTTIAERNDPGEV